MCMRRFAWAMVGLTAWVTTSARAGWMTFDAFDRPDSTDLGPGWVEHSFDSSIESEQLVSTSSFALATWQGQPADPASYLYGGPVQFDVYHGGNDTLQYAAAVLGFADVDNYLLLKIQDNGAGVFHRLFFYYGNSGEGWAGMTGGADFESLAPEDRFTQGRVTALLVGDQVTIDIDTDFDGVADVHASRGGIPMDALGDSVGLGNFGASRLDDFRGVPDAPTMLLLASGILIAVWWSGSRRRLAGARLRR